MQPGLICEKPIRSRLLIAKVLLCRQVAHKTKEKGPPWAALSSLNVGHLSRRCHPLLYVAQDGLGKRTVGLSPDRLPYILKVGL